MRASAVFSVPFLCAAIAVPAHTADQPPKTEKKAQPAAVDLNELLSSRDAELNKINIRFAQTRDQLEQERRDHADQIEKMQAEIDELKKQITDGAGALQGIDGAGALQGIDGAGALQGIISQRERQIEEITKRNAQARNAVEGLKDKDPVVRRQAIRILSKVGVGGKTVDAAVQKAAQDPDPEVQKAAKEILERKSAAPKKVEPSDDAKKLAELQRELELERKTHATLLARRELQTEEATNRYARLRDSMSQLKADFESVAVEGLNDKDPAARRLAVRMLSKIGASGRLAGPALQKAAEDPDPQVQQAAREALKKQGPAASKGK